MSRVVLHIRKHYENRTAYIDSSGNIIGAKNKLKKLFKEDVENNTVPEYYSIQRVNSKGVYKTDSYSIEDVENDFIDTGWDDVRKIFKNIKEESSRQNYKDPSVTSAIIEDVL